MWHELMWRKQVWHLHQIWPDLCIQCFSCVIPFEWQADQRQLLADLP